MDNKKLWKGIPIFDSDMGIKSSFRVSPLNGKAAKLVQVNVTDSCRENISTDIFEDLEQSAWNLGVYAEEYTRKASIQLDAKTCRLPESTALLLINDDEFTGADAAPICTRACCAMPLIHFFDAIAGLPSLLLNPTRYVGDWWQTDVEKVFHTRRSCRTVRWYGCDNFLLRHPSLTSLVLGLFRQALCLHALGKLDTLLEELAPRKEVVKALDTGDVDLAARLVQNLEPLLLSPVRLGFFPLGLRQAGFLLKFHRAIYKHGFDEVFDGTLEENTRQLSLGRREGGLTYRGFRKYFGLDTRANASASRVLKLAS